MRVTQSSRRKISKRVDIQFWQDAARMGPGEVKTTSSDDILYGALKMIQPEVGDGPRVNVDTILLADFARFPGRARVLEMGCAHGTVALILAKRRQLKYPGHMVPAIDAFDINPNLIAMARRNAEMNDLSADVNFFVADLREHRKNFPAEAYDAVVMNPPYDEIDRSRASANSAMATAMHGECATLREVAGAAKYLLKNGGKFFLVIRAKRIGELLAILSGLNLKPKRLRFVHPKPDRTASVALVEAVRASGDGLTVEPPLFIHGPDGAYTEALMKAYRLPEKEERP